MDTVKIDGEDHIIMKRTEYLDVVKCFIIDGRIEERKLRERDDAAIYGALKFYANESNYQPKVSDVAGVDPDLGIMQYDISNVVADNGTRARDIVGRLLSTESFTVRAWWSR